jgi:methionine aminopeptidase
VGLKTLEKDYTKTEDDLKAVQSVGQIVAEILKQLDDERCKPIRYTQSGQDVSLFTDTCTPMLMWMIVM